MNAEIDEASVNTQIANFLGDSKTIVNYRILRMQDKSVAFLYGISDNTCIVARRPDKKCFKSWEHLTESFDEVWKKMSMKDIEGVGQ